jgi:hypothetical protein
MASHLLLAAKLAFVFLCVALAGLFVLWLAGVAISASVASRQTKRGSHRVGGALK